MNDRMLHAVRAGALALVLGVAGCSATGEDTSDPQGSEAADATPTQASEEETGQQEESATDIDETDASPSADPSEGTDSSPEELQAIGERPASGEIESTIVLNDVTVNEGTMTVQFTLENDSEEDQIQVGDMFANGVSDADEDY